jgi:hypothetical protein
MLEDQFSITYFGVVIRHGTSVPNWSVIRTVRGSAALGAV